MSDLTLARSPLDHTDLENFFSSKIDATVSLEERKFLSHLNLRGDSQDSAFVQAFEKVFGLQLPLQPCSSNSNEESMVWWLSPDEWLVLAPHGKESNLEEDFRRTYQGHFSLVDTSGGQTLIEISGADAVNVMKKSTSYDMHVSRFPIGKVVGTHFAQTGAVIRRCGDQSFQLIIRRSFADYIWLWLQKASEEYL